MTTKDRVLASLLRTEEHLSGEALSRELGISRAAVHAAVQKLREEGFRISSATNRGYRLEPVPDLFSAASLLSLLGESSVVTVMQRQKKRTIQP